MYRYSEHHKQIGESINKVISETKTLDQIKKELKKIGVFGEDIQLANCRMINIFTGSSGYDIVGYSIIQRGNKISVEEMYD